MKIILMCGLPGSGKSKIAKLIQNQVSGVIVCRDNIREMLYKNYTDYPFTNENENLVKEIAAKMIIPIIDRGINIIIDETNLTKATRQRWIFDLETGLITDKIICVWVQTKPEVCKQRRQIDHKGIEESGYWDNVIDGMVKSFEEPEEKEFDKLIILNGEYNNENIDFR
jgi:predicted kinase